MKLPERLTANSFAHWNFLIRGLMEVWEVAIQSGWEKDLEQLMEEDDDGRVAEELGRLGNELLRLRMESARSTSEVSLWSIGSSASLTDDWPRFSQRRHSRVCAAANGAHA